MDSLEIIDLSSPSTNDHTGLEVHGDRRFIAHRAIELERPKKETRCDG